MMFRPLCASSDGGGRHRMATAALTLLLLATLATVGLAAGSSTAAAASTDFNNTTKFAYIDSANSQVTLVNGSGEETALDNASNPSIVGTVRNYDSDGAVEVPYVTSQGKLYLVDRNGENVHLADGSDNDKTKIAAADLDGDGTPAVIYPNESDNYHLYKVENGSAPVKVTSQAAFAVSGYSDFDGDGDQDLTFVSTSSGSSPGTLMYYDNGTKTVNDTGYSSFGVNSGIGVGAPADLNRDGEVRVPVVDGSGNIDLVNDTGVATKIYGGAEKAPIAPLNWTGDAQLEILYVSSSGSGPIEYTTLDGSASRVKDASGNDVNAVSEAGVASAEIVADPLLVTDFNATATGEQNVTVTVNSSNQLSTLEVDLSGPENATLTRSDFSESGAGPYTYTATYNGSSDGTYNVTLVKASDGAETITGREDTAAVGALASVTIDGGDRTVDEDTTISFSANASGSGDLSYDWSFGDGYSATGASVSHMYADPGTYTVMVTVTDGNGDEDTDSVTVTVEDTPSSDDEETTTQTTTTTTTSTPSTTTESGSGSQSDEGTTTTTTTSTTTAADDAGEERSGGDGGESDGGDGDATDTPEETTGSSTTAATSTTESSSPGFGAVVAVLALLAVALLARRD